MYKLYNNLLGNNMKTHWRLASEERFTKKLLIIIDAQVDEIIQASKIVPDPDAMGYFDEVEHTIGLGFVILQNFITAFYSNSKAIALNKGPRYLSGVFIAVVINDAANYWKHHKEWSASKDQKHRERIEDTFKNMHCSINDNYPLSNILAELSDSPTASFIPLLNLMLEWQLEL